MNKNLSKISFAALWLIAISSFSAQAQKDLKPSASFVISGEVKKPVTILSTDLSKGKVVSIGDVTITNHLGEKKSEAKGLKGVLLTDVLQGAELNNETPRVLSEYYFVCKANDGYTVVFSWNELYNTATGKSTYLITEKEGQPITAMNDAILLISTSDFRTGRRHLKALASIEVKRAK